MLDKILAACVVAAFSAGVAYAGTCTPSDRYADSQKVDVNIKVKNDTKDQISVSIWKGTETSKETVFAHQVLVPSDGKEGKTDKNVKEASFYFSAKVPDSDAEALCGFDTYTSTAPGVIAPTKSVTASIDYFSCADTGGFKVSCEKAFDKNKFRWNVTYSIE